MNKSVQRIRKVDGQVVGKEKLLRWLDRYLDKLNEGEYCLEIADTTRTNAQNNYYWAILTIIAATVGTTPNEMHAYYKAAFLPTQEYITLIKPKQIESTTQLTKSQYAEYLNKVIMHAAEIGIVLPSIEEYKHQI